LREWWLWQWVGDRCPEAVEQQNQVPNSELRRITKPGRHVPLYRLKKATSPFG
jgi:hypothetical protein